MRVLHFRLNGGWGIFALRQTCRIKCNKIFFKVKRVQIIRLKLAPPLARNNETSHHKCQFCKKKNPRRWKTHRRIFLKYQVHNLFVPLSRQKSPVAELYFIWLPIYYSGKIVSFPPDRWRHQKTYVPQICFAMEISDALRIFLQEVHEGLWNARVVLLRAI